MIFDTSKALMLGPENPRSSEIFINGQAIGHGVLNEVPAETAGASGVRFSLLTQAGVEINQLLVISKQVYRVQSKVGDVLTLSLER